MAILDRDLVQPSISGAESQRTVLLLDEEYRRCDWGFRRGDATFCEVVVEVFAKHLELLLVERVMGS